MKSMRSDRPESGASADPGQQQAAETQVAQGDMTGEWHRPSLGKRLKIRSMVTMAGEVLPFFWPMRNFIHHNPLHGLEHLPFEQAVAEASHLFHAQGYLKRTDYQRLMERGSIEPEVVQELVAEFVADWLAKHDSTDDRELAQLLQRCLEAMMTRMSQPAPGDDVPAPQEVLAGMRRNP